MVELTFRIAVRVVKVTAIIIDDGLDLIALSGSHPADCCPSAQLAAECRPSWQEVDLVAAMTWRRQCQWG